MQNAVTILGQVAVMAIFALIGLALVRTNKLLPETSIGMSNILIYAVTPCIIIGAMQRDYAAGEARAFLLALLLSAATYMVSIAFAQFAVPRGGKNPNAGIERFAAVMPNTGYIGIPLVQAVLGSDGVFFLTAYIVCFNLVMFSYGRYQLSKDGEARGLVKAAKPLSRESVRRSLVNPASVSVLLGGALYLSGIRLPSIPATVVSGLSGLNSVLSMLLVGIFLSKADLRVLARFSRGLLVCAMRLVLLPLLLMLLIAPLDVSWFTSDGTLVKTTLIIASCTPVSVSTAFMGELCGADNLYGTNLVVVSTLLSVATLPLMLLLWDFISAAL